MDRSREARGRGLLRRVLAPLKVGVLVALVVAPLAGAQDASSSAGDARAGCAHSGSGHDRAAPALIRTDQGRVRQVSFEVAWDVYNGRRPGTVIAVCVDGTTRR